jgi:hypothetical protein
MIATRWRGSSQWLPRPVMTAACGCLLTPVLWRALLTGAGGGGGAVLAHCEHADMHMAARSAYGH